MPFKAMAKFGKKAIITPVKRPSKQEKASFDMVFNVIKHRRSIRSYQNRDVSNNVILKLIEAATYAPSAGNTQPWEFIIVRNQHTKDLIGGSVYGQNWIEESPVIIVACVNMRLARAVFGERGTRLYGIQAVASAIENFLIAAEAHGLGTCWIGAFSEPKLSVAVKLPEYIRPAAIITLGWPAEKPEMPARQALEEVYHIEEFGETGLIRKVRKDANN